MYKVQKVFMLDFVSFFKVSEILRKCGKDMAEKYGLNHWNNSIIKNIIIVLLCALRNKVYLVYEKDRAVATFQLKKIDEKCRLQKLATSPQNSGKGIGSFCMNYIEETAKKEGCKKVCLEVYDKSVHAGNFYSHRGYKEVGKTNTLKYTEILMEKEI